MQYYIANTRASTLRPYKIRKRQDEPDRMILYKFNSLFRKLSGPREHARRIARSLHGLTPSLTVRLGARMFVQF